MNTVIAIEEDLMAGKNVEFKNDSRTTFVVKKKIHISNKRIAVTK